MFTISKRFEFAASHVLEGLPPEHPCSRLHGHNYTVEVVLRSEVLNEVGFVYDYRALGIVKDWIDKTLDHRHLNDVFDFNPTAEQIARDIWGYVHLLMSPSSRDLLYAVRVMETPKTSAEFCPAP